LKDLYNCARTPEFVDSVMQDEEEEEIFFGSCSQKERSGAFAKYVPKLTASVVEPEMQEVQLFWFRIQHKMEYQKSKNLKIIKNEMPTFCC
jgi:hypothetical protein